MHHKSTLNGYLAEFANQSLEKVMEDTDRDFFMSAEEQSRGLIDSVIDTPHCQYEFPYMRANSKRQRVR